MRSLLRSELPLLGTATTAVLFALFGEHWTGDLGQPVRLAFFVGWLFAAILTSAFAVVRHADALASKLGEPYGTLVLTLAVTTIEVMMLSAVMLAGEQNPTLAREAMYAVVMIVLGGLIGLSLLLGGLRHGELQYNLQGANAFLALIVPLAAIALVLPSYTESTSDATFSPAQEIFLAIASLSLYAVFLLIQTVRHRAYFEPPLPSDRGSSDEERGPHPIPVHAGMLIAYLVPVAFLTEQIATPVDHAITGFGAPTALGGILVASLVLAPEALGGLRAARANHVQRAVNIFLGSVTATISLTLPAVLAIGLWTGHPVVLGLGGVDRVMLVVVLAVSLITFASGRANVVQGAVHLVLFGMYVVLIFD